MDITVIKIHVDNLNMGSLLYQDVFVMTTEHGKEKSKKIPYGEEINANIKEPPAHLKRVLKQLNLYFASCQCLSDNIEDENWNTKEKVDDQTRIKCDLIDYDSVKWVETEVDGKLFRFKHFRTRSISFNELDHLDACAYFDRAFKYHAEKMKMEVDKWIECVKSRMRGAA